MMKRLKFLLVFVFLLVGTLTVLAFTTDKYRKLPAFYQCLKYTGPQILFPPYTQMLNPDYWGNMYEDPFLTCDGGEDICAICFDNSLLTPNDAREILWEYYRDHGSFPLNGTPIIDVNWNTVWVYTKTIE